MGERAQLSPPLGAKACPPEHDRGLGLTLCCVKQLRCSHALNTKRVRDRDRAPLSITNKSRKCLILGPPREMRSRSVSSGEPLSLLGRTSGGWRLTRRRRGAPCPARTFLAEVRAGWAG